MPELPEVETVCAGLRGSIDQKVIETVGLNRPDLRFPFPKTFVETLGGQTINRIHRLSKYILIDLSNNYTWMTHLGMSGKVLIHDNMPNETKKHDHVVVRFTDGSTMIYNDARRFGFMELIETNKLNQNKFLSNLGPDPYGDGFDANYLYEKLRTKNTTMKAALMDQRVVAGLGNIYVCESLFDSGIRPDKKASTITKAKAELLYKNIMKVLDAAIASGGSTLRDYVRSSGDMGYFQHKFKVYGRENKPCFVCETPIKRIVQNGRSSFYCSKCQK